MTFLELAKQTLEKVNTPLTIDEIWGKAIEFGLSKQVLTTGKTPQRSIGAQLYVNIRDKENSDFCIGSQRPTRFALRKWGNNIPANSIDNKKTVNFKESDLHPILSYFAYNYLNVLTKTIDDKISKAGHKGKNEWIHPDIVGLEISAINNFNKDVLLFSKQLNQTPISVFSFELKRIIEFSNLRESYFQAVSNSRWANKGYLVCAEIDLNDDELINELGRLSSAYGIGVIKLEIQNPDESKILFESKDKSIEWGFVNYLLNLNSDYKSFIQASIDILKTETPYKERFDKILSLEEITKHVKCLN